MKIQWLRHWRNHFNTSSISGMNTTLQSSENVTNTIVSLHQHISNLHLKLISVHELSFLRDRRCSCKDVPQGCYVGEGPCNHDKECTGVIIILNIVAFKETTKEIPLYSKLSKRRITCNFYIKVACIYFWKKCIQSRYDWFISILRLLFILIH